MGLINNDVYTCSNGVQKAQTYLSLATETIYLCQASSDPSIPSADRIYNVRANYRIYWDEECRMMNKPFIDLQSISTQLTNAQLDSNLYGSLYAAIKLIYPNTSDVLIRAAPFEPVAEPAAEPVAPAEPAAEPVAEPVVEPTQ